MRNTISFNTGARARKYGSNGGKATAKKTAISVQVEGGWYTYKQLAEILGISETTVKRRVVLARYPGRPILWVSLGKKKDEEQEPAAP